MADSESSSDSGSESDLELEPLLIGSVFVASKIPKMYWASHTILVDNIERLILTKKPMISDPFTCPLLSRLSSDESGPCDRPLICRIYVYLKRWKNNTIPGDVISMKVVVKPENGSMILRNVMYHVTDNVGLTITTEKGPTMKLLKRNASGHTTHIFLKLSRKANAFKLLADIEYEIGIDHENFFFRPTILQHYLKLLETPENADIAFIVEGEQIMAHKCILSARSDYFAAMFKSDSKENVTNKVQVPDADPRTFRALLEFIHAESRTYILR